MGVEPAQECWRSVAGHEGYYEVSDLGNVRSIDRTVVQSNGKVRFFPGRVIRPRKQNSGYLSVGLKRGPKVWRRNVHRLVLEAFEGPCPGGMTVRHLNGDQEDNRLVNLRYGTLRENMLDQVAHGTHRQTQKTHCPRGHALVTPNLVKARLERGMRDCRACAQARSFLRIRPNSGYDLQSAGDMKYAALMR